MNEDQRINVACADVWMRDCGMPTYTELMDAAQIALDILWVLHGNGFESEYERAIAALQAVTR